MSVQGEGLNLAACSRDERSRKEKDNEAARVAQLFVSFILAQNFMFVSYWNILERQ